MARLKKHDTADTRKICAYLRKSKITEKGKSIEVQKEKCIALACERFNVEKDDVVLYVDEGKSGYYGDRPAYMRMLKDIENNKIRAVICHKIDRVSRRTIDLLNFVQELERMEVAFISVTDRDIDTSNKLGRIMITLLSAIAEFERDIIAERIVENLYEIAKDGHWLGGICPLGYESKKEKISDNGRKTTISYLVPSEDGGQTTVKRLYELFLQTSAYNATATRLNAEGYKTQGGNSFTSTAVINILRNPVYAIADKDMQSYFASLDLTIWAQDSDFDGKRGIMAYNKTEQTKEIDPFSRALDPKYTQKSLRREIKEWIISVGKHEGIISGADWIRVQALMADIAHDYSARPKEASQALLSGVVRCEKCGRSMYVQAESGRKNADGTKRYYYYCGSRRNKDWECDKPHTVRGHDVDKFVIEQICNIGTSPEGENNIFYDELLNTKKNLQLKTKENEKESVALRKRLAQIEKETENQIISLRTAPENHKPKIYKDMDALDKERDEKQARLDAIHETLEAQDSQIADIEKAKQTIMDFPRLINLVDYEGKLQLLRRVLECVIVKGDIVHIFLKGSEPPENFIRGQGRSDVRYTEVHSIAYSYQFQAKPWIISILYL